jgi:chromate transporter
VIGLGVIYEHTQNDPHVKHLFAGLAAAAAGLLVAMAVKILLPLRHDPRAAAIAALGFVAIALLRFPLLPTMLVLTPLSIFLASRVAKAEAATAQAQTQAQTLAQQKEASK